MPGSNFRFALSATKSCVRIHLPTPSSFGAPRSGLSLCPQHGVGLQRQISAPGSRLPPGRRLARSVPHRRRPGSLLSSISRKKKKKIPPRAPLLPPRMKSNLLFDFGVWSRRREARRRRLGWGPGGSSPPGVVGVGGGGAQEAPEGCGRPGRRPASPPPG